MLFNIEVNLYKSKKFNNNISSYSEESIEYLRKNVLFVDIVIKFNCCLVDINKLN